MKIGIFQNYYHFLEFLDYQDSDSRIKNQYFLIEHFSSNEKLWLEFSAKNFKTVVVENYDFEYAEKNYEKVFGIFVRSRIGSRERTLAVWGQYQACPSSVPKNTETMELFFQCSGDSWISHKSTLLKSYQKRLILIISGENVSKQFWLQLKHSVWYTEDNLLLQCRIVSPSSPSFQDIWIEIHKTMKWPIIPDLEFFPSKLLWKTSWAKNIKKTNGACLLHPILFEKFSRNEK